MPIIIVANLTKIYLFVITAFIYNEKTFNSTLITCAYKLPQKVNLADCKKFWMMMMKSFRLLSVKVAAARK